MDREEAIKFADGKAFELLCQLEACRTERQKERINEEYSFVNYARACIEKEIPLQVCNISVDDEGIYGNCANCGRKLVFADGFGRCPECGQAIEWSGMP